MFPSFNARALGLDLPPEAGIELASAAGFVGVDLPVRDLVHAGAEAKAIRGRLEKHGLRPGAWPLPMSWRGDPKLFEDDLRELPRYAEFAGELGLTRTATWVLPAFEDRPGSPRKTELELIQWHVERLVPIARVLAEHGVRLGLEVIGVRSFRGPSARPFVCRMAQIGPLLTGMREHVPEVGLLVDSFHLHAAGETVTDVPGWDRGAIVWAHVADLPADASGDLDTIRDDDRGLPGERNPVATASFLRQLNLGGYSGPVTVETFRCRSLKSHAPREVAQRAAVALRSVWPGP